MFVNFCWLVIRGGRERERERKSRDLRELIRFGESRQEGTRGRDKVIGDRFRRKKAEFVVPETVGTAFRGGLEEEEREMDAFLPR